MTEPTDTELADHVEAISAFQEHVESRAILLLAATRLRSDPPVDTPSVRARALEEAAIEDMTWVAQHNPNCPSPYLVRLPRGAIDMKPYAETGDAYGFGKTLNEAFDAAIRSG